jgi:hypothetical protein
VPRDQRVAVNQRGGQGEGQGEQAQGEARLHDDAF